MSNAIQEQSAFIWQEACAASLAGLTGMGPGRLRALLSDLTPEHAWAALGEREPLTDAMRKACGSKVDALVQLWHGEVRKIDPLVVLERYHERGIEVWTPFTRYPARLADDEYAPVVLFAQGDATALDRNTVGIIGTRRCTYEGRVVAQRFGRELSEAGVSVMSGLALGIDGAAHVGALEAAFGTPPIAVVGNGLDSVYPKRHQELWARVRDHGLIIGESPLGALPEAWRFPARNRILAGLCDVLLVIESHEHGGSLITAREALDRNKLVMAVPGSIQKPAGRGTNRLLADGATMVCNTQDVLMALGAEAHVEPMSSYVAAANDCAPASEPSFESAIDEDVLFAVDWQPTSTDDVMMRTGLSLAEVSPALSRLAQLGWLRRGAGWWERSNPPVI